MGHGALVLSVREQRLVEKPLAQPLVEKYWALVILLVPLVSPISPTPIRLRSRQAHSPSPRPHKLAVSCLRAFFIIYRWQLLTTTT